MDICRSAWTSPRGTLAEVFVLLEEDPPLGPARSASVRLASDTGAKPSMARNCAQNTGPGDQIDWVNTSTLASGTVTWCMMQWGIGTNWKHGTRAVRYDARTNVQSVFVRIPAACR